MGHEVGVCCLNESPSSIMPYLKLSACQEYFGILWWNGTWSWRLLSKRIAIEYYAILNRVMWCIHMCDVTRSHVRHDLIACVVCRFWIYTWSAPGKSPLCDVTCLYVWRDSFIRVMWRVRTYIWLAQCKSPLCDVTHSFVGQNWLIHMAWPNQKCDVTHPYICLIGTMRVALVLCDSFICITWLNHTCGMTLSYMWCDAFIYISDWHNACRHREMWLIHMYHVTQSYMWRNSFIHAMWWIHIYTWLAQCESPSCVFPIGKKFASSSTLVLSYWHGKMPWTAHTQKKGKYVHEYM